MDATRRDLIMQRWNMIQHDLLPELKRECGALTPRLEKLVHKLFLNFSILSAINELLSRFGCFRTFAHAEYFCVMHCCVDTLGKQAHKMLTVLQRTFDGNPKTYRLSVKK